jgi:low temperature requirement protein LtrA
VTPVELFFDIVFVFTLTQHAFAGDGALACHGGESSPAAQAFHIAPAHFVERHGLLVIIALGESVIAIGAGVDAEHLSAGTIGMIVLALALPGPLWWTYFVDTPAAEHALTSADAARRSRLSTRTYVLVLMLIIDRWPLSRRARPESA